MPELPEVTALADYIATNSVGRAIARVDVATIQVLKTYDPPIEALRGKTVTGVDRRGKFLDINVDSGLHLVLHLARAGWIRRLERAPATPLRPGRSPIALRIALADHSGWDVTEQGTTKRLAAYVVRELAEVPGIARLGVDPTSKEFTVDRLTQLAADDGGRLKGFLTDQRVLAGIGNAYSDEIAHTARLSPYSLMRTLTAAQLEQLYAAIKEVLSAAVQRAAGVAARNLKAEKKLGLRVHGLAESACPVCGDTVRSVHFAGSSLQYCATCQTNGRTLADRRLSRLLK